MFLLLNQSVYHKQVKTLLFLRIYLDCYNPGKFRVIGKCNNEINITEFNAFIKKIEFKILGLLVFFH